MNDPLELFFRAARDHANRPAVVETAELVTYSSFLVRVQRLAAAIARDYRDHYRVAIVLPQGAWAYASMFAALMVGGFYAPVNLEHPLTRRQKVISLFEPTAVIATSMQDFEVMVLPEGCRQIALDSLEDDRLMSPSPAHDLAYVMFTSGSTGEPKGVEILRSALAHYVDWAHRAMNVVPQDRWSQHPNIAFDLSVLDIYGALCAGASLYPVARRRDRLFPAEVIRRHGLTIWNSVPSVIDLMRRTNQLTNDFLKTLRLVTFCGEPLLKKHVEGVFAACSNIGVHNTYGPTEATVSTTLVSLSSDTYQSYCRNSVALGESIDGMTILLEGGDAEGEIVIAGPQVARGYWRDDERTAQAFGTRLVKGMIQRCYKTGDWAQCVSGKLYFVSRRDRQIKRNGHRIELGDIDAALRNAGAPSACTIFLHDLLIAFVGGASPSELADLPQKIRTLLPPYSLPDEIRFIDFIPTNANDKIDTKALERLVPNQVLRSTPTP